MQHVPAYGGDRPGGEQKNQDQQQQQQHQLKLKCNRNTTTTHSPEDGSFFSSLTMLASMNSLAGAIEIISWSPMASFCDYTRSPTSPPTILLTSTAPPSSTLLLGLFFAKVHDNKNSNVRNGIRLVHMMGYECRMLNNTTTI